MAGFFGVLIVAGPGVEGRVLESTGKAKSDRPGVRAALDDGGEVGGGLFDGLAARKENHSGEFCWNVIFENFGGGLADFGWGGLMFLLFAGENHVAF